MKKPKLKALRAENTPLYRHITPPALKKGDLRKLEIIEATVQCLARFGWQGTNYETVGQACQLKRPHVAYHFPQWDELIYSTIQYAWAAGQTRVGDYLREVEGRDPKTQLRAYIDGTFDATLARPAYASVITLLWHLASFHPRYRALAVELKTMGARRLFAILNPGVALKLKTTRGKAAVNAHALLVGRVLECLTTDPTREIAAVAKETFDGVWALHRASLK